MKGILKQKKKILVIALISLAMYFLGNAFFATIASVMFFAFITLVLVMMMFPVMAIIYGVLLLVDKYRAVPLKAKACV